MANEEHEEYTPLSIKLVHYLDIEGQRFAHRQIHWALRAIEELYTGESQTLTSDNETIVVRCIGDGQTTSGGAETEEHFTLERVGNPVLHFYTIDIENLRDEMP